ncbi:MAG TPA: LysM peptidoglycan-binding domain-containing protein, partial [Pirellulales bacterium]|nr:LysM peptidoglycan-binding domain-containing protein [Pirellulales bacterium]
TSFEDPMDDRHFRIITVQLGDSLNTIAARECKQVTRWPEIAQLNGIGPPYTIFVGQKLVVPSPDPIVPCERGVLGRGAAVPSLSGADPRGHAQFGAAGAAGAGRNPGPLRPTDSGLLRNLVANVTETAKEIGHPAFVATISSDLLPVGVGYEWTDPNVLAVPFIDVTMPLISIKAGYEGTLKVSRPGTFGTWWLTKEGQLKYEQEVSAKAKALLLKFFADADISVALKPEQDSELPALSSTVTAGLGIASFQILLSATVDSAGQIDYRGEATHKQTTIINDLEFESDGTIYVEIQLNPEALVALASVLAAARMNRTSSVKKIQTLLDQIPGLAWDDTVRNDLVAVQDAVQVIDNCLVVAMKAVAALAAFAALALLVALAWELLVLAEVGLESTALIASF